MKKPLSLKNRNLYTLLLALCVVGFWLFDEFYFPPVSSFGNGEIQGIEADYLPSSTTGALVYHRYYTLSYSEPHEQAEWVAYGLKREHLTQDDRKRPYFIEDPGVRTGSADWRNYRGSGYDRGHLVPAGDRRFSEAAYNETFYTSNISPQDKEFNAGVWNRLEQQVRQWCRSHGDLIVVTGGVLEEGLLEIGSEDVDVPKAFFKIVLRQDGTGMEALAFLVPAVESTRPLSDFLVSIDSLEVLTGLDFFEKQSMEWQREVEAPVGSPNWKF